MASAKDLATLAMLTQSGGSIFHLLHVRLSSAYSCCNIDYVLTTILRGKHPNAIVYNQCLNLVLEEAVKATKTRNYRPHLESIADDEPLPPFPRRGEVDLILAGPQCTGYSGLNR